MSWSWDWTGTQSNWAGAGTELGKKGGWKHILFSNYWLQLEKVKTKTENYLNTQLGVVQLSCNQIWPFASPFFTMGDRTIHTYNRRLKLQKCDMDFYKDYIYFNNQAPAWSNQVIIWCDWKWSFPISIYLNSPFLEITFQSNYPLYASKLT